MLYIVKKINIKKRKIVKNLFHLSIPFDIPLKTILHVITMNIICHKRLRLPEDLNVLKTYDIWFTSLLLKESLIEIRM